MSSREKMINFCDRAMVFCFCVLIYTLPISIALVEIFSSIPIILYFVKRTVMALESGHWPSDPKSFLKAYSPTENSLNLPIAIFMGVCILTVITSSYPGESFIGFMGKVLQNVFVFFAFVECMTTKKRMRIFLISFFVSFMLICVNGNFQLATGKGFLRDRLLFRNRVNSSFRQPNDFGGYLISIIPILVGVLLHHWRLLRKGVWVLRKSFFYNSGSTALLVLIVGILALACLGWTYSRGAWLSFGVGMLLFGIKGFKRFIIALVIVLMFFLMFYQDLLIQRIPFITWDELIYFNNRTVYWQGAWTIFKDNPFLGTGLNTYSLAARNYAVQWGGYPHNCYLQMAAETGILGVGSFFFVLFSLYRYALKGLKTITEEGENLLYLGILVGLTAFLVHISFDTTFYSVQLNAFFWIYLGILVAFPKLQSTLRSA